MSQEALLLTDDHSSATANVAKLLHFFGICFRTSSVKEFTLYGSTPRKDQPKPRLICSANALWDFISESKRHPIRTVDLEKRVHSVFVYGGDDRQTLERLARILRRDKRVTLNQLSWSAKDFVILNQADDFCGIMSGLAVTASNATAHNVGVLRASDARHLKIISSGDGSVFLRFDYNDIPVFLLTTREIIDIDAELTGQNFDVRDHFLSAVPIVLYIKWAFAETCWKGSRASACLIIDDPLLKPTYGFINFRKLLDLMGRHRFSTNIAFIPWNWRRNSADAIKLLRENPKKFSVSVHGCDHTRAEFGSPDRDYLYAKAQRALGRMHRQNLYAGLRYDRVMVFPQGVFSEAAMSALKHTALIAAVNNDVISADGDPRPIRVSDVWDTAIMSYSNFALFSRRYPWEGVENFAFDILLGKPAIIVIHHDYCSDDYRQLVKFVKGLNGLKCSLIWDGLGEIVRRSYRYRRLSRDVIEVEMYGNEVRLDNPLGQRMRYRVRKRESEPSLIKEIRVNSAKLNWRFVNDYVDFEIELGDNESKDVCIKFQDLSVNGSYNNNVAYKLKVMARRHACEFRDNYIAPRWLRLNKSRRVNPEMLKY